MLSLQKVEATVLIVDDREDHREFLMEILTGLEGFMLIEPIESTTVAKAELKILDDKPDLVLLDVIFEKDPDVHNYEGVRALQRWRSSQHRLLNEVPVIVVTVLPKVRIEGQCGSDCYWIIEKPRYIDTHPQEDREDDELVVNYERQIVDMNARELSRFKELLHLAMRSAIVIRRGRGVSNAHFLRPHWRPLMTWKMPGFGEISIYQWVLGAIAIVMIAIAVVAFLTRSN